MNTAVILAVVGPTAVGKTQVAFELARHVDAEIVSLDSRLVYRHLNIGTAKPCSAMMREIRHHLIDRVEPWESYCAADFVKDAKDAVGDIQARGRAVLLVGGSGWYLKALMGGLDPFPASDPAVRRELSNELEKDGVETLYLRLAEIDKETASRIHPHDRYRIMRALEIYRLTGETPSEILARRAKVKDGLTIVVATLYCEKERLDQKIEERARMILPGLVNEAQEMLKKGCSPDCNALMSIGYRETVACLEGKLEWRDLAAQIVKSTRLLAKRQMVWWRGAPRVNWVYSAPSSEDTAARLLALWREDRCCSV